MPSVTCSSLHSVLQGSVLQDLFFQWKCSSAAGIIDDDKSGLKQVMRMNSNEITDQIKAFWNETSDSEWYRSLRTEERISRLQEKPESAFHPAVYELIRKYLPELKGRRILLPSSGDNHAAFALAMMDAHVTSADISERQLENASSIAERLHLEIEFICDDTMKLSHIRDQAYDMVYTSNGTLSWISDIDSMNRNIYRVLKTGGYSEGQQAVFRRSLEGPAYRQVLSGCFPGSSLAASGYHEFANQRRAEHLRIGRTARSGCFFLVYLCRTSGKES